MTIQKTFKQTITAIAISSAIVASSGIAQADTAKQQKPFWPNDAQLVISISMQFEATAQDANDPGPFPKQDSNYPDTIAPTWYQYGMNEGVPRLLDLWDKHDIKVTSHMVGRAVELNPELAKEVVARGHDG